MCTKISQTIILILLVCFVAGNLGANSDIAKTVNSKITEVTVYQNRAKVIREVTLSLPAGDHSLSFENIPILSDETSFHASASGENDPFILGLSHLIKDHLETPQEKAAELEKEILDIEQGRKLEIDYRLAVLERKKEFLLSLLNNAGKTMPDEIERGAIDTGGWNDGYLFFGDNLGIISDSLRDLRLWTMTLKDTIAILKKELVAIKSTRGNRTRTIQVDLRLESEGEITVALDYVVSQAGWAPIYDARLNPDGDQTELELFAEIKQKTGEDWENVKLTLSTSEPTRSAGPGEIPQWYLSDATPVYFDRKYESEHAHDLAKTIRVTANKKGIDKYVSSSKVSISRKDIVAMPIQNVDELRQKFAATFETSRNETIISGDKATRVPLAKWNLDSKTNFICRPKLNRAVFRQVEITNQFDSPLLLGQVSLFAGTDFIGKTGLFELIAPGQTFDLDFGVDNRIEVNRKLLSNKKTVSDDRIRIAQTIEIKLKNWSKFEGSLKLEEPFPVSQDNRIKAKYKKMNPKPDSIDKQGKAEWKIVLQPSEEKIVTFTFVIIYPKGMRLSGI